MPSASITARPYLGALTAQDILAAPRTVPLADLGPGRTAALLDPHGDLGSGHSDETRFDGTPIRYLGAGIATPAADVAGAVVPLGTASDIVIFEAGGQMWFHYPGAVPATAGQVAVVIDVTDAPYDNPTCPGFCRETLIDTPTGPRPIEDLRPGDRLSDSTGRSVRLIWTGTTSVNLRRPMSRGMRRSLAPVRLWADGLAAGRPDADLWASPRNLVLLSGFATRLLYGLAAALVPALSLVGPMGDQPCDIGFVTYHHILCERPCIIRANGVPTRTEMPGGLGLRTLTADDRRRIARHRAALCSQRNPPDGPDAGPAVLTHTQGRVAAIVAATMA